MRRTECQFSLVRYVPDPVKDEFVNIGVVVRGGGTAAVGFTHDWTRVRCLDPDADVGLLESLEEDMRSRLEHGGGHALEKPMWEMLEDSFSNSLQLSEAKGCLATSVRAEVAELLRLYVEPPRRQAPSRKVSGRAALVQRMRGEFERAGVWRLMNKRIAAARYTQMGDPLRLDCGYRSNGTVRLFQAVSLQSDADAAKVMAFTMPALAAGVERVEMRKLQWNAVIEPLRELEEDGEEIVAQYRYGVRVMEQAGLRVLTALDLERAAQTARQELNV
jgi:hypothetical protein